MGVQLGRIVARARAKCVAQDAADGSGNHAPLRIDFVQQRASLLECSGQLAARAVQCEPLSGEREDAC